MKIGEWYEKQIIRFWTSRWDYISLYDAIKEVNQSGYKGVFTIRELKGIYNKIEQFQL
jgi:endo-alpha-1,4-polygalactosaminidase (GH114 family)